MYPSWCKRKEERKRFLCVSFMWYSLLPPHGNRRMFYFHLKPMSEDYEGILILAHWRLRVIDNGVWLKSEKPKFKRCEDNPLGLCALPLKLAHGDKVRHFQRWIDLGYLKRKSLPKEQPQWVTIQEKMVNCCYMRRTELLRRGHCQGRGNFIRDPEGASPKNQQNCPTEEESARFRARGHWVQTALYQPWNLSPFF